MFCRNESATRQVRIDSFGLSIGNREVRADRKRGKLVDRVASGTPIRKLLFIEAFGHADAIRRVPAGSPREFVRTSDDSRALDADMAFGGPDFPAVLSPPFRAPITVLSAPVSGSFLLRAMADAVSEHHMSQSSISSCLGTAGHQFCQIRERAGQRETGP
jgi:hypothetical protein